MPFFVMVLYWVNEHVLNLPNYCVDNRTNDNVFCALAGWSTLYVSNYNILLQGLVTLRKR